jgi:hypothetical protein
MKIEFKLLKIRGEEYENWLPMDDPIISELIHSK